MTFVEQLRLGRELRRGSATGHGCVSVQITPSIEFARLKVVDENTWVLLKPIEIRRAIELLKLAHEAMTGKKP